jgi:serine/threonine protein kinase
MDNFPKIPGYKIKKILGEGGMSIVYLAIQEKLKRKVAVKVIHPHRMKDAQAARRFLKEAETASKLNHSNIVSIIDFGEADNVYYLAMEYLPSSLSSKIKLSPKKKLPPAEALTITEQVADALDYAHSQGIIHRDIKSENILFRRNDTPVVVDFGIARTINSTTRLTRTGISIGTIHYMSPEQCRAEVLDGRSDLYSLGIVLYEMLTGGVPFDAKNEAGVLLKHLQESIPSLPDHLSPLQPIIKKLLEKDRDKRIKRGRDLVRMITNLQSGISVDGDDDGGPAGLSMPTVEIPHFPPKSRRWKVLIGGSLIAAIIVGVIIYNILPTLLHSPTPPIKIPQPQTTVVKPDNRQQSPNIEQQDISDVEYASLIDQAKNLINTNQFDAAAEILNRARQIKPGAEIAELEEDLQKRQSQAKRKTAEETARKKRDLEYVNHLRQARRKLEEDQFQVALDQVSKARSLKETEELDTLEDQIKRERNEAEREALLRENPPKTVNIFAISSDLQKKYNEILKRIEISGPQAGTWVSGQVSISLAVNADGEIEIADFLDKWLTIKPDTGRVTVKESIISRIKRIELSPPISKEGTPVVIQGWRMSFKVETFQGKIILDLQ